MQQPIIDNSAAIDACGLRELMQQTSGAPAVHVAVIDGAADLAHPAFADLDLARSRSSLACQNQTSPACQHGTAVLGVLAAARGAGAPALCPGCRFSLWPVFGAADRLVPIDIPTLATAVRAAVGAGARVINLSVGLSNRARRHDGLGALHAAYDLAQQRGTLVVAAAGNFAHVGYSPLLDHPWVIPVAAADADGRLHASSNAGQRIGRQGVLAPGAVISTLPGGGYGPFTGTSAATPFVAGALALLLSLLPRVDAARVRFALLGPAHGRRSVVPPPLDAAAALRFLRAQTLPPSTPRRFIDMSDVISSDPLSATAPSTLLAPGDTRPVIMAGGSGACSCGGSAAAGAAPAEQPTYIYALGTLRAEWSSTSARKEYDQVAADLRSVGTEGRVKYEALKRNRYLAREACWIFAVEKQDVYRVLVRDSDLDALIEAIEPVEREDDQDLLVGTRGPLDTCGKFTLPVVLADRLVPFRRQALFEQLEVPAGIDTVQFKAQADDLFSHVRQFIDNVGASDRDRAYNYLLTRYPQIYALTAQKQAQGLRFEGLETQPSRLADTGGKLVNVVLRFADRRTEAPEKYYVRVDVSGKYPFLASRLAPFYDR